MIGVGMVLKRLVIAGIAACAMLLVASCTAGEKSPGSDIEAMDCARFSRVILMGFSVANPDYRMEYKLTPADECRLDSPPDDKPPSFSGSLMVKVGPRVVSGWPYDFPGMDTEFRQEPSGEIRIPHPGSWYLTELLNSFGGGDAGTENRQTVDLIKGLRPLKHIVHALVELREPLSEEEARKLHDIGIGEVVILSPGQGNKPVGWSFPYPGVIGGFDIYAGKKSVSRVREFQRWVSLLRPEDEPVLDELGLDLAELRDYAGKGRVYGFTIMNYPGVIKSLTKNPKVHSVRIIDVAPEVD
ncbi:MULTISPECIES: hypothetical protein [unclassified Streptosporangium]|uniref:hypothetical protein n=1 Tax=unclassified Streptosporangium TaxID=2632669 RepID=UPI002E2D6F3C|nr:MULTISPECIES: hypothetical protein [unclassified Streptosporangium]